MLTRSKQRLIQNNENINKENNINRLKRKRSNKSITQINKENLLPSTMKYSLRSQSKLKSKILTLKSKNENNIINEERVILKDKNLDKNVTNISLKKQLKTNMLKENATINKTVNKTLKEKGHKNNNKVNNKDENKDSKVVVLIEGNKLKDKIINKIHIEKKIDENKNDENKIEKEIKKIKIEKKQEEKILLKNDKENKKIDKAANKKDEIKTKKEKNDQKTAIKKSSIANKNKKNDLIPKEKKKITFDDNVQQIDNSIVISDSCSFSSINHTDSIKIKDSNNKIIDIDSLSPIKKNNNEIIVPFIKLDSDLSSFISTSSNSSSNNDIDSENKLERKSSGLSDKSLELLTDFTRGSGKVQLSDLLESLSGKEHIKSSTPNSFNKTLFFLEESPINYTRILNEEMNFHTPLNESTKYPEKEVSNLSSQNTSFQDSNSLSNFINISPISNSDLHPTDSDFDNIHSGELIDESDLFNTEDKSLLYSMDELDEKIKKLLSGNDNKNLITDDENKSIIKYTPISPESLNKRKINNKTIASNTLNNNDVLEHHRQYNPFPHYSKLGMEAPVVEEITYDDPENANYLIHQDSSSDDPFGFSKAEKIYKTKQQKLKNSGPHTPISSNKLNYTQKKESHSLDSVNEILYQEHQQVLNAKKNRNKKKIKIEDMEKLNSDDLKEIKQAKDEQMKYFKEIDEYVLNETIL